MPLIRPFKGFRPVPAYVAQVACPPYDIVTNEEAWHLAEKNKYSLLPVIKPEINYPRFLPPAGEDIYAAALRKLEMLQAKQLFIQDQSPCFYLYRLKTATHQQTGLVATVAVSDYEQGRIKKHELTRPDKEEDRIKLISTLKLQTGPAYLTFSGGENFKEFSQRMMGEEPLYQFIAEDRVEHTLWLIANRDEIERLIKMFGSVTSFYIADGHHRSAAAVRISKQNRHLPTNHGYHFFLAVIFPHEQLRILPYNRLIKDLQGLSPAQFLTRLESIFKIQPLEGHFNPAPTKPQILGMYLSNQWYSLELKIKSFEKRDLIGQMDVSILQQQILAPLLGIHDPRTDKRIEFVGGVKDHQFLQEAVNRRGFAVAFSLYPCPVQTMMEIADQGQILPPKSTWFEPKLRSGLVMHRIDD